MLKNICSRIISAVSALVIFSCVSLPQIQVVYAEYGEYTKNNIAEETTVNKGAEELTAPENNVIPFEYDGENFSVKAEISSDAVFSLDSLPLNADEVQLSVSVIDETDERYEALQQAASDDEHELLLYEIGFFTKDSEKADVSELEADVTFYYDKPYANCEADKLSVIKFTETSAETDEGSEVSFECSETEITGSTYVNDELTDVAFHIDSLAVYGILIPETELETKVSETIGNAGAIAFESPALILSKENNEGSTGTAVDKIEKFDLGLESGAALIDGKYIWTADTSNEGHGFTYKLSFSTSGTGEFAPGEIEIRIPKNILRDKDGNFADELYLPYPAYNEEYDESRIQFVYREDTETNEIVIYNVVDISAGSNQEIPFMYETTEKTWEYEDMKASVPCKATVTVKSKDNSGIVVPINAETPEIPVYIDTSVQIKSTSKSLIATELKWSDSWGLEKPSDADDYIYFTWKVSSSITDITQKYDFQITDTFNGLISPADKGSGSPEVIGYRMQGSSKYTVPVEGSSPVVTDLTAGSRIDYVLTRCRASDFTDYCTYELSNGVTATVTPADKIDSATSEVASAIGKYEKIEPPEPVYSLPGENYKISKYGIYGNKQHVSNSNNISFYDLEQLKNGTALPGLTYHIQASANAYIKTLADDAAGTEQDAIDGKFGQKNVTYSISDSEIYLNDSQDALSKDDYTFTSLEYSIKMQDASYSSESKSFNVQNVTDYKESDILTFYVMTEDNGSYIEAATYNLYTGKADIADSSSISSLTGSSVTFKNGVKGWKIATSNPYYSVSFNVYPIITLNPTEAVKAEIPDTDNAKLSVKNSSTLNVVDSTSASISRSASGTDYVAKVQRNSNISKKVVSAKNYPGIRGYKVNWETSISETYTDESGTVPVRQESGVFYDLIPIGCRVDLSSVKVYADGEQLLESEYTVDDLQENYKNSNRTLLTVRINTPAEKNYKITYTTVHLWEDVLDYGRYVLNSVAYETGNPDIANGYPDNGGSISDSTILADLDPETNDKRFLYSQATHSINALIPLSSGITKKVASADDASFGDKTIVHPDSSYVYSIRMENASKTTSKNIVIFDSLENFCKNINGETGGKDCDWRGTLESFGLANLEKLGINPVIYLSRTPDLNLAEMYSEADAGTISFDSNIWTKLENFGDISEATAFAIDLTHGLDGKLFELGENRSFSFTVTMRSPATIDNDEISPETYNNVYRSFVSIDTQTKNETPYYEHYDYTTVVYRTVGDLRFQKLNGETNEPIQGIKFNLSGTSDYGTAVDKELISDSNGIVYLADLERGEYLLTETDPTVDFLKGADRIVKVDNNGNVTITPDDGTAADGVTVIKNQPRVHGDLSFLKVDELKQSYPVIGAVFTLTGTSDYGNKIEKTAVSDGAGVFFEDVEKGTYTLTEISAPSDYTKLKDSYTVVCGEDGILSIVGLTLNSNGDYVITNMPRQEFRLIKLDSETSDYLQGAVFHLQSTATQSGEVIEKDVVSRANGIAYFDGLDLGTYTLTETTPPEGYYRDTNTYTVVIALNEATKEVTVTITCQDENSTPLEVITAGDTTGFKFTNEAIPEDITIVKKWEGDSEKDRPPSLIIHLSTDKPARTEYKATITDTSTMKTQMTSATKLLPASSDNTSYVLEQITAMAESDNPTAWRIGVADGTADKQKDVYLYKKSTDSTEYYYWSEAQTIYLPSSCNQLFSGMSSLNEIDLSELNSSKVTNMRSMFYNCSGLTSLDLSNFNTSNVGSDDSQHNQSMYRMFYGCSGLTSLDLSSFDTSNVTTMQSMFEGCSGLTSLILRSSFDTSNVTDMYRMFYNCSSLTSLDLSKFNTSNVTTMQEMFSKCSGLISLDLSSFNTSNITSMYNMFYNCSSLTSLNLSSFNTSNVTTMKQMFYYCFHLTSLDLSSFDTSNVTDMTSMFYVGTNSNKNYTLTTIYVSDLWSTKSVTSSGSMFYYCYGLEGGNGTKYSVAKVQNHAYARIDDPENNSPGYFTYKAYPPSTSTSSSSTETQVTSLFNSVSKTVSAYKASANASLMVLPTLMYASETTTPTQAAASSEESTSGTSGTGTSEKINYDTETLKITPTKVGNTWTYVIPVHDADVLYYVWEETVPNGYTSDATNDKPKKVNDPDVTRLQTITNTKNPIEKGNLTLSKTVTKGGSAVTSDTTEFTFIITLSGDNITEDQYFDAYTFIYDESTEKASAEVKLQHGESITISGIPAGTAYTIQETSELYGYTSVTPDNASGTIEKDTTASVTWENQADNRDTGEFHVSKTVELYKVTEKLDGTKTSPEKIELTDNEKNQEFTFTAVLTKLGRSGTYTIQKSGETLTEFTSDTSGNATVTFTLKSGETADFTDIPIGATYKITEKAVDGYTASYSMTNSGSGGSIESSAGGNATDTETLESGEDVTAAFTNSKTVTVKETVKTMDITAEKQWAGDDESDRPKSITIYLERYLDGFPNNAETIDTAIITPHNSEWKAEFIGLPETDEQGRTYVYTVREESVSGYTCAVSDPVTDSATGNQTFTITNTKIPTYDLTINKTVEGVFGSKAKQFEFTVTLTDKDGKPLNGFYTLKRGDDETLLLFDAYGQAKIGVSHGEEAVIKNLPQETKFTVTENDYGKEGYTTKSGLDQANLTENSLTVDNGVLDADKTVYFVNSREGILPTGIASGVIPLIVLGVFSLGTILLLKRRD